MHQHREVLPVQSDHTTDWLTRTAVVQHHNKGCTYHLNCWLAAFSKVNSAGFNTRSEHRLNKGLSPIIEHPRSSRVNI